MYQIPQNPHIPTFNTPLIENNHWRLDELNTRLTSRIYPDAVVPQSIAPRSVETRQTILGKSLDPRNVEPITPMTAYPPSNSSVYGNFIPGDSGEPNWFLANIDTETILRNQCFALQGDGVAPQATYIPASNSELYKVMLPYNTNYVEQPFPHLFERTAFSPNQRTPVVGVNTADTRNHYIGGTYTNDMYRGGTPNSVKPRVRNFYNVDRASLAVPFNQ
jgi:hypothetical protein